MSCLIHDLHKNNNQQNKANQAANLYPDYYLPNLYTEHFFSTKSSERLLRIQVNSENFRSHHSMVLHHSCRSCTILAGAAPFHGRAPFSLVCTFFGLHVASSIISLPSSSSTCRFSDRTSSCSFTTCTSKFLQFSF